MPISLRITAKFLVLVLGILILSFGVLSLVMIAREEALLARKNREQETLLARTVVAGLTDSMLSGHPRNTLDLIARLESAQDLMRIEVLRPDGSPAFGARRPRVSLPEIAEAFREDRQLDFVRRGAAPVQVSLFPLKNDTACRRCHRGEAPVLGVILLTRSLAETYAELSASKRQVGLLLTAAVLAIGVVLYLVVRLVVLSPLRSLHHGARIIGLGNLGHRIAIESHDEFQDVAAAFNEMAGRLKETYADLENQVRIRTAELNRNLRLMRGILSSMSSGVVLLARDGTVKLINRQGAWILGHGHDNLAGKRLAEVVPEAAAFQNVRVGSYDEITVRTADDAEVPVGFTSAYFSSSEGDEEGLIVVFQDLTELKTLQAELVNRERFAAMGRVVAGVAHEIRNPLFGISAIGQILERDLTSPDHQELSRALIAETKRLNHLVEELLVYGRPMRLKLEPGDLRILWEEVLDLHRDELQRRQIKLMSDYSVRHPAIRIDAAQIRQVFLNILRNSLDAMPDGGTLTISMLMEDEFIAFRVADTGAGIAKDHRDRVFDLFYTTKPKGTGLGLAICRKIVQDHGGDISIASEEGKGTAVTIRLPYRRDADRADSS